MVDPLETSILNASVSDQAAARDALGFAPYVTAMAEFLTNPQTKPPLTLSVEGEWGSGKSLTA
jgi:predicted KAP-like P-loop ATPase